MNADFAAYWTSDLDGYFNRLLRVYDKSGREVFHRAPPRGPAFVQQVWLTGAYVVVEEIDDAKRKVRIIAYDLTTGQELTLPAPGPTQPEIDAGFGRVEYTSGSSDTRMCQQAVDLATLTIEQGACAGKGEVVGDVALGRDSSTFSIVSRPDRPGRCKRVLIQVQGKETVPPAARRCLPWSGAVGTAGFAWDEMDPKSHALGEAVGYVLVDGRPLPLGDVETDSIIACGDAFFWTSDDGRGPRIDRWTDVDGHQTVWGPEGDPRGTMYLPTMLRCGDGRWLYTSIDQLGGDKETSRYIVLDTEAE